MKIIGLYLIKIVLPTLLKTNVTNKKFEFRNLNEELVI